MGIMGIFLGPVILAVTYNLLKEWVEDRPRTGGRRDLIAKAWTFGALLEGTAKARRRQENGSGA